METNVAESIPPLNVNAIGTSDLVVFLTEFIMISLDRSIISFSLRPLLCSSLVFQYFSSFNDPSRFTNKLLPGSTSLISFIKRLFSFLNDLYP